MIVDKIENGLERGYCLLITDPVFIFIFFQAAVVTRTDTPTMIAIFTKGDGQQSDNSLDEPNEVVSDEKVTVVRKTNLPLYVLFSENAKVWQHESRRSHFRAPPKKMDGHDFGCKSRLILW